MAKGKPKFRILGHAKAVGPGKNVALIGWEATDRNHVVLSATNGPLEGSDLLGWRHDVLLLSISPPPDHEEELELLRNTTANVIVVFDTHDAYRRIPQDLVEKVDVALVSHPIEVQPAREWGYHDARYVVAPPLWSNFLRNTKSREAVRSNLWKFKDGVADGVVTPEDVVMVVGGVKNPYFNNKMFAATVAAGRELFGSRLVLAVRPHPREVMPQDDEERLRVLERRRDELTGVWQADTSGFDILDPLVPACDWMIFSGGMTAVIYAGLLRLPSIYYEDPEGLNTERMEEQLLKSVWLPVDRGVTERALGYDGLIRAIRHLHGPEGLQQLRDRQKAFYPEEYVAAMRTPTEKAIVDIIEQEFLPAMKRSAIATR